MKHSFCTDSKSVTPWNASLTKTEQLPDTISPCPSYCYSIGRDKMIKATLLKESI